MKPEDIQNLKKSAMDTELCIEQWCHQDDVLALIEALETKDAQLRIAIAALKFYGTNTRGTWDGDINTLQRLAYSHEAQEALLQISEMEK